MRGWLRSIIGIVPGFEGTLEEWNALLAEGLEHFPLSCFQNSVYADQLLWSGL